MIWGGIISSQYLLALNAHPKIGSQTLKKMLAPFSSPKDLWEADASTLRKSLDEKTFRLFSEAKTLYSPEGEMSKLAKHDVGYITIYDREYPKLLKQTSDCPVVLYVKGDSAILDKQMVGIVGSRKYSAYGQRYASKFAEEIAASGLVIASGMALGIDAFAHRGAIDGNGLTVGVLGCGLDKIYPISNFQLGKEIIDSGGALISEFPLGTPPLKQNFPARNRIIAGISKGVLVVEAAVQSGALITAYQAIEYNREVFALPGNIGNENSVGTNRLIKEGASLVESSEEILQLLNIEAVVRHEKAKQLLPEITGELEIVRLLGSEDLSTDDIVRQTGLNIVLVNSALTFLEMKGHVENLGGGRYRKVSN